MVVFLLTELGCSTGEMQSTAKSGSAYLSGAAQIIMSSWLCLWATSLALVTLSFSSLLIIYPNKKEISF